MTKFYERIYHRVPVLLQNILVSIYGDKLYRERYNRYAKKDRQSLERSEHFIQAEMDKFVDAQFVSLAKTDIEIVPFYRTWAQRNQIKISDICGISDFSKFPTIKKSDLKHNPKDFFSDSAEELIKLNTSGTTGSPLDIYCSNDDRCYHYAFFSRLRSWFGLARRSKRAAFFGRIIMFPENQKPPFWRSDLAQNNLLISSYHLSEDNLVHYYRKLVRY